MREQCSSAWYISSYSSLSPTLVGAAAQQSPVNTNLLLAPASRGCGAQWRRVKICWHGAYFPRPCLVLYLEKPERKNIRSPSSPTIFALVSWLAFVSFLPAVNLFLGRLCLLNLENCSVSCLKQYDSHLETKSFELSSSLFLDLIRLGLDTLIYWDMFEMQIFKLLFFWS